MRFRVFEVITDAVALNGPPGPHAAHPAPDPRATRHQGRNPPEYAARIFPNFPEPLDNMGGEVSIFPPFCSHLRYWPILSESLLFCFN